MVAPAFVFSKRVGRGDTRTKFPRHLARMLVVLGMVLAPAFSHATTISFQATDLVDTTAGQDLWQYSYVVSDATFDTDYGFSIYFDYSVYALIESPPPIVNGDWDIITFQPDLNLPDDGAYDALALSDAASLTNPFTVNFLWFGSGSPGSQPFDVYEPGFSTIESGTTVPEPGTGMLLGMGLLGLSARKTRLPLAE